MKTDLRTVSTTGADAGDYGLKDVVVLAGGVGGARLAHGLARVMPPDRLTIIVNTGDDFEHMGLTICPDLDTVMYTLAGSQNPESGWGRQNESWMVMEEVGRLGGPEWFRLGDRDLATHLVRSHQIAQGVTLTEATEHLCRRFGLTMRVLPMSDRAAPTLIRSDQGVMTFQEWFVAHRWQPPVREVILPADVRATPQVMAALEQADVIMIAPSNPFVSVAPILNVYPVRAMVMDLPDLVMAVSPIIAGQAVKGPAAKMMAESGLDVSAASVARYYQELIDVMVYDVRDSGPLGLPDLLELQTDTLMPTPADRERLAREMLDCALELLKT